MADMPNTYWKMSRNELSFFIKELLSEGKTFTRITILGKMTLETDFDKTDTKKEIYNWLKKRV